MKKICFVVPDGVGIKNYLYSSIISKLSKKKNEIVILHNISSNAIKNIENLHGFNVSFKKIPGYEESVKQKFLRELISLLRIYNNIKLTKNESLKDNWNPKKKRYKLFILHNN